MPSGMSHGDIGGAGIGGQSGNDRPSRISPLGANSSATDGAAAGDNGTGTGSDGGKRTDGNIVAWLNSRHELRRIDGQ